MTDNCQTISLGGKGYKEVCNLVKGFVKIRFRGRLTLFDRLFLKSKNKVKMKKYAVIIKHAFRDYDYRVDVYEVEEDTEIDDIRKYVLSNLMGNFVIVSITERLDLNCAIK